MGAALKAEVLNKKAAINCLYQVGNDLYVDGCNLHVRDGTWPFYNPNYVVKVRRRASVLPVLIPMFLCRKTHSGQQGNKKVGSLTGTRTPSADDVAQVVANAKAKGCHEALLVYPTSEIEQLDERVWNIRVRSVSSSLDGDLEMAGNEFLRGVLR